MKRFMSNFLILGMIMLLIVPASFAQKGPAAVEKYNDYYDQDKFDSLAGEDGTISEEDWNENRTGKEGKAFGDARWDKAKRFDTNGDGELNVDEAAAYKRAERKTIVNHPGKAKAAAKIKEKYPNATPDQIRKAVNNPKKARAAYKIKKDHPNAKGKHIRKAKNNPKKARAAYKIKKNHPNAKGKHVRKAANNPKKARAAYKIKKNHPNAKGKHVRKAANNPKKARAAYKVKKNHSNAKGKHLRKAKNNPQKARQVHKNRRGRK